MKAGRSFPSRRSSKDPLGVAARLPGISGSYFSTGDSVANSITGDIDLRAYVALADWSGTGEIIAKNGSSASYDFSIAAGKLKFVRWTTASAATANMTNVVVYTNGSAKWVRATYATATGVVNFYDSSDGVNWTQIDTKTITSGAIDDSTASVGIGQQIPTSGTPLNGAVYRAQIYNGIAGALNVDFDPTRYTGGTTFTAATGEVWTVNGLVVIA